MSLYKPLPEGPFQVVAADVAWKYNARSPKGLGRAPERHYKTMSLEEIAALPIASVVDKDASLWFWITGPHLAIGSHIPIMRAWGFEPTAMAFVWCKKNDNAEEKVWQRWRATGRFVLESDSFFMSLGKTTRQNAEYVVLGRRGNPKRLAADVRQILIDPRREHSRKPDSFYQAVERYAGADLRKLDLFPREQRPGWISWGDEEHKFDD
jgi:N6-adenosine-specific RNA methylase IME4